MNPRKTDLYQIQDSNIRTCLPVCVLQVSLHAVQWHLPLALQLRADGRPGGALQPHVPLHRRPVHRLEVVLQPARLGAGVDHALGDPAAAAGIRQGGPWRSRPLGTNRPVSRLSISYLQMGQWVSLLWHSAQVRCPSAHWKILQSQRTSVQTEHSSSREDHAVNDMMAEYEQLACFVGRTSIFIVANCNKLATNNNVTA